MAPLTCFVHGLPAPQGSKRYLGRGVMVEASKRVRPWREAVVAECLRSGLGDLRLDEGTMLEVVFFFPRPASHYGTGRNAGVLKPMAPLVPKGTPDLDKLVRSTMDALTQAGTVVDDARFSWVDARKRYCDKWSPTPGAWLRITPDEGLTPPFGGD